MMTYSAQNMRKGWGDSAGLFVGRRETVESVTMETMALQIVAITVTTNQEHGCSALQTSVSYAKIAGDVRRRSFIWEISAYISRRKETCFD